MISNTDITYFFVTREVGAWVGTMNQKEGGLGTSKVNFTTLLVCFRKWGTFYESCDARYLLCKLFTRLRKKCPVKVAEC